MGGGRGRRRKLSRERPFACHAAQADPQKTGLTPQRGSDPFSTEKGVRSLFPRKRDLTPFIGCRNARSPFVSWREANLTPKTETPMPGTVRLHRVLKAPPERVYRAFLHADA